MSYLCNKIQAWKPNFSLDILINFQSSSHTICTTRETLLLPNSMK